MFVSEVNRIPCSESSCKILYTTNNVQYCILIKQTLTNYARDYAIPLCKRSNVDESLFIVRLI